MTSASNQIRFFRSPSNRWSIGGAIVAPLWFLLCAIGGAMLLAWGVEKMPEVFLPFMLFYFLLWVLILFIGRLILSRIFVALIGIERGISVSPNTYKFFM
jgi:hypothetical protein